FFSSRRRHTRCLSDWSSDVCSSDLDDVNSRMLSQMGQTRKLPRRDFQVQIGRAVDLTCVMATPEIASSPPTINFRGMRSPRNNTLEIKANTGSSKPNGATRPMEQRAISQNQSPNPTIPPMKIV